MTKHDIAGRWSEPDRDFLPADLRVKGAKRLILGEILS